MKYYSLLQQHAGIHVKPTWCSYQWFMKTPSKFGSRLKQELVDISRKVFGHPVSVEMSDMEIWTDPQNTHRYLRYFIYIKGLRSPNTYLPLARYIGANLGEGIWGMYGDTPPTWSDNGNEYIECSFSSPFLVVQIGKYVSRDSEYEGLFSTLEEAWDNLGRDDKLYFDELRDGRVNWMQAGNLLLKRN